MQDIHYLVPDHIDGAELDIAQSVDARSIEDAEDWFVDAKERLLDINNWHRYGGINNVRFELADAHGKLVKRSARRGDHIRIDVADSVSGAAGGFDWATIEAIEYDDYPDDSMETFAIRIHPSEDPEYKNIAEPILFMGSNASSTFVVVRNIKEISAAYFGRNELAYAHDAAHDLETIDADAPVNCWLGLAESQWDDLMKGLLK